MRHLILTLAILSLVGCGPGPKSAKADEQPAAPKETYTAALQRVGDSVAAVKGDTGIIISNTEQTNARLEAIESKLDALLAPAITVPQVVVPEPPAEPAPVKADAPPAAASSDQRITGPTLNGKPLDVAATIKASYRRMWSFPGSIDSHLAEHGVAGTAGLDYETKRKLHSALHEMGIAPKAVVKERVVVKAPIVLPQQSCPSGNCPNVRAYGYTNRSWLFGRRR